MTRSAAALTALGLSAAFLAAPGSPALADQKSKTTYSCCSEETVEAYPGDDVDGRHIRHYVFLYADLDNDGVLRGKELRRAKRRAIIEDRGSNEYR